MVIWVPPLPVSLAARKGSQGVGGPGQGGGPGGEVDSRERSASTGYVGREEVRAKGSLPSRSPRAPEVGPSLTGEETEGSGPCPRSLEAKDPGAFEGVVGFRSP